MRLIVNADDFGRSLAINQAVALGWEDGILTSASLMVAGSAADHAVALARQHPRGAVGLHVTLTELPPVLPAAQVPHLIDRSSGCFPKDPAVMGWRLFWSRAARRELARELAAQFERFASFGLPLSHVDGHQHLHVHPVVFDLLLPLAERYGAAGIRLPRESLPQDRRGDPAAVRLRQAAHQAVFAWLSRRASRRMPGHLFSPQRTFGLMYTGQMDESHVLALLREIPAGEGCVEMYCHPTTGDRLDAMGPNPGDLEALLSPRVKHAVAAAGITLANYPKAAAASASLIRSHPRPRSANLVRCADAFA